MSYFYQMQVSRVKARLGERNYNGMSAGSIRKQGAVWIINEEEPPKFCTSKGCWYWSPKTFVCLLMSSMIQVFSASMAFKSALVSAPTYMHEYLTDINATYGSMDATIPSLFMREYLTDINATNGSMQAT